MQYLFIVICSFIALSCREILPYYLPETVNGYLLKGTVINVNGFPVTNVEVKIYYHYTLSPPPVDTQKVNVSDSSLFIDVSVYTPYYLSVRSLYSGTYPVGTVLHRFWDGNDDGGKPLPSGKYFIRYKIGSDVVKQVPYIIDGNLTAKTDSMGQFKILQNSLPVGERFDMFNRDDSYDRTVKIISTVDLELKNYVNRRYFTVELIKDQTTTEIFTL